MSTDFTLPTVKITTTADVQVEGGADQQLTKQELADILQEHKQYLEEEMCNLIATCVSGDCRTNGNDVDGVGTSVRVDVI